MLSFTPEFLAKLAADAKSSGATAPTPPTLSAQTAATATPPTSSPPLSISTIVVTPPAPSLPSCAGTTSPPTAAESDVKTVTTSALGAAGPTGSAAAVSSVNAARAVAAGTIPAKAMKLFGAFAASEAKVVAPGAKADFTIELAPEGITDPLHKTVGPFHLQKIDQFLREFFTHAPTPPDASGLGAEITRLKDVVIKKCIDQNSKAEINNYIFKLDVAIHQLAKHGLSEAAKEALLKFKLHLLAYAIAMGKYFSIPCLALNIAIFIGGRTPDQTLRFQEIPAHQTFKLVETTRTGIEADDVAAYVTAAGLPSHKDNVIDIYCKFLTACKQIEPTLDIIANEKSSVYLKKLIQGISPTTSLDAEIYKTPRGCNIA